MTTSLIPVCATWCKNTLGPDPALVELDGPTHTCFSDPAVVGTRRGDVSVYAGIERGPDIDAPGDECSVVVVDFDGDVDYRLTPFEARVLARRLSEAADLAER